MAKSSKAALSRQNGDGKEEMIVQNQEIDTPVLPVDHMERLHQFRPDVVDWILKQTETEAADRRERQARLDSYVCRERMIGQIFGLVIGLAGIGGGAYVAVSGHPTAGGTIASIAIGTLAVAFIGRQKRAE